MAVTQTIVLEITELTQSGLVSMDPGNMTAGNGSAGFISGEDKEKLDGIQAGAEVNKISSIYNMGEEVVPDENGRIDISYPFITFYGE